MNPVLLLATIAVWFLAALVFLYFRHQAARSHEMIPEPPRARPRHKAP